MNPLEFIAESGKQSEIAYRNLKNYQLKYGDNPSQAVDIFVPEGFVAGSRAFPVMFFIHGGYWVKGNRSMMGHLAIDFVAANMIYVTIGYRLSPDAKYPAAFEDCKNAVIATVKEVEKYGGDPTRLVLSGHSAGGNLSALLMLQRSIFSVIPESSFALCCPVSGVFTVATCPPSAVNAYLADVEADARKASPIYYESTHCKVPFYLLCGSLDFDNVLADHPSMLSMLQRDGCEVQEFVDPGKDHFAVTFAMSKRGHPWMEHIIRSCAKQE